MAVPSPASRDFNLVPDSEILDFFGHNHPRYTPRIYNAPSPALSIEQFATLLKKRQAAEVNLGLRLELKKQREIEVERLKEQAEKELAEAKEAERIQAKERRREKNEEKDRVLEAEADRTRATNVESQDSVKNHKNEVQEARELVTTTQGEKLEDGCSVVTNGNDVSQAMEIDAADMAGSAHGQELQKTENEDKESVNPVLEEEHDRELAELEEKLERLAAHKHALMVNLKKVLSSRTMAEAEEDHCNEGGPRGAPASPSVHIPTSSTAIACSPISVMNSPCDATVASPSIRSPLQQSQTSTVMGTAQRLQKQIQYR